ncbi:MAG: hypothetical protein LH630_09450 [Actinomycetia bacterium]|nr:hypothetical protein [Actinomycetes bacterium]
MTTQPIQATVHELDASTGTGSVITDHGEVITFTAGAWTGGALRTMRQGQRVRAIVSGSGASVAVISLTLVTFPLSP